MTNIEIGRKIRVMREARGLTQKQLADAIGKSESAVAMYEAGKRRPKDDTAEALADVFNVPKWSILYRENEMVPAIVRDPAANTDDSEAWKAREDLLNDPNRKALLKLARFGTDQDVRQVAALIDALRATNPEFYDGDDPS